METVRGRPLTPENLKLDFGIYSSLFQEIVPVLASCLTGTMKEHDLIDFREWEGVFEIIYGTNIDLNMADFSNYKTLFYNCQNLKEVMFILQTYLALVIKCMALGLLIQLQGKSDILLEFRQLSNLSLLQRWKTFSLKDYFLKFHLKEFFEGEYFDWIFPHASLEFMPLFKKLSIQVQSYNYQSNSSGSFRDLFRPLYQELIPQKARQVLGEYFTPDWLAQHLVLLSGYSNLYQRVLDPCCGSGTFLLACLERLKLKLDKNTPEDCLLAFNNIVGFDINPISVLMARFNFLYAFKEFFLHNSQAVRLPIFKIDSLQLSSHYDSKNGKSCLEAFSIFQAFDFIIGNPPWIQFEFLSEKYRRLTQDLWKYYSLLDQSEKGKTSGRVTRGNTDLSLLFTYVSADFYLKSKGTLAFIITQKIFQLNAGGERFRRFLIDESNMFLNVKQVQDLTSFQPFPQTSNKTALLVLQKDTFRHAEMPVYYKWKQKRGFTYKAEAPLKEILAGFDLEEMQIQFLGGEFSAQWQILPISLKFNKNLFNPSKKSFYKAQGGIHPAGASGIYILEKKAEKPGGLLQVENQPKQGKKSFQQIRGTIESKYVYPLLRGRDIQRWCPRPKYYFLLPHSPSTGTKEIAKEVLSQETPLTLEYLLNFENQLKMRKKKLVRAPQAEFYQVLDVRTNQFSPIKVVWRRMGNDLIAAVCETQKIHAQMPPKPIIPLETVVYVPLESIKEAHFLCALLNSQTVRDFIKSFSPMGRGFATPSILSKLRIPKFDPEDSQHQHLAFLSSQAHRIKSQNQNELVKIEQEIEKIVNELFKTD